jgi:hypothetical protein
MQRKPEQTSLSTVVEGHKRLFIATLHAMQKFVVRLDQG